MTTSLARRVAALNIADALAAFPTMELRPGRHSYLALRGDLPFKISGPTEVTIEDSYRMDIHISLNFPRVLPLVYEVGGRIGRTFHKLKGGALCLGSPVEIRLTLGSHPDVKGFIQLVVLPYLYGHSYFEKYGVMPFGELSHSFAGLRRNFADILGVKDARLAEPFARLCGMRRRVANKYPCPCGSGIRLGRCHHLPVNQLRKTLGRGFVRATASELAATET